MKLILIVLSTYHLCSGIRLSHLADAIAPSGHQRIKDHGDSYLTIRLDIGYQTLSLIPDSGSFDLYIVDGDDCRLSLCKPAYRPKHSHSHLTIPEEVRREVYFGSGACSVALAYDEVRVHDDGGSGGVVEQVKQRQVVPVWQIDRMDDDMISVWGDGRGFQGIVGLGFKGGMGRETEEVEKEKSVATSMGVPEASRASALLFGDVFAVCLPRGGVANIVSFAQRAGTRSILLEQSNDDPHGTIWWGQSVPQLSWSLNVPVVGQRHWTISFKSASVGSADLCEAPCAALVDSGTSLIALKDSRIDDILRRTKIGDLAEDCSNVQDMPDIIITFENDQIMRISPESYIMRVSSDLLSSAEVSESGRISLGTNKVIVVRKGVKKSTSFAETSKVSESPTTLCTYAFMESPIEKASVNGEEQEVIILGIPVFREYSIKFDRKQSSISFARHPEGADCDNAEALALESEPPVSNSTSISRETEEESIIMTAKSSLAQIRQPLTIRSLPSLDLLRFPSRA